MLICKYFIILNASKKKGKGIYEGLDIMHDDREKIYSIQTLTLQINVLSLQQQLLELTLGFDKKKFISS